MQRKPSQLVNGRIPPHQPCPFTSQCPSHGGTCHHKGVEHTVAFSCGYARAFDLIAGYPTK